MANSVVGMVISSTGIQRAAQQYKNPNVSFQVGDLSSFTVSEAVHTAVSFETIEPLDTPPQFAFMGCLKRALATDGLFAISTPERAEHSPCHNQFIDLKLHYKTASGS
jgi:2-polyprenyl-3-methyl-5-hydroxy-6-metoxy-1,4-benzoquinol methylase